MLVPDDITNEEDSLLQHGPIWADAPLLKGLSRFEPSADIRNIMITGAAGFIGSWVARHLTTTYPKYNIVSFDKLDYCATWNNNAQLRALPNFSFFHGDVTVARDVLQCLRMHDIDTVMHFAAQTHVDLSFGNSFDFTSNNVNGAHVMLECVRQYGQITRFIHVSTDEVYGEVMDDDEDLLETALLEPTNPYAASKAAAEMYMHAYRKSFNIPLIIVRSNNIFGPHQYPEKVIPKFILLLRRGEKLSLHGSGKNTRRYLWAGDAADAFDTVLHRGTPGHVYNVSSRDEISNLQLCKLLLQHFHPDSDGISLENHVKHVEDRPFNDHRYAVDATRLKALGWEQRTSFANGLRMTVDWYKRFGDDWWGDIENRLTPFPELPSSAPLPLNLEANVPPYLGDPAVEAESGSGAAANGSVWSFSSMWSALVYGS